MTSSCTSPSSSNFLPAGCLFRQRNNWKSLGSRSGLYGERYNMSHLNFSKSAVVPCAECGRALSWSRYMPATFPFLLFRMSRQNRVKVSQYGATLIVAPGSMKSTRRMPFLSQKTDAIIFFTENEVSNFLVLGECVWRHCSDCAWIQSLV